MCVIIILFANVSSSSKNVARYRQKNFAPRPPHFIPTNGANIGRRGATCAWSVDAAPRRTFHTRDQATFAAARWLRALGGWRKTVGAFKNPRTKPKRTRNDLRWPWGRMKTSTSDLRWTGRRWRAGSDGARYTWWRRQLWRCGKSRKTLLFENEPGPFVLRPRNDKRTFSLRRTHKHATTHRKKRDRANERTAGYALERARGLDCRRRPIRSTTLARFSHFVATRRAARARARRRPDVRAWLRVCPHVYVCVRARMCVFAWVCVL